jgi:hypothetical protein
MMARRIRSGSAGQPLWRDGRQYLFWDEKTAQSICASAKIEKLRPLFLRGYLRHCGDAGIAPAQHGLIMSTAKFEPFGERLPENGLVRREQPKAGSSILSAIGQGCFWLLVVTIVVTRAYFAPATSFSSHVASPVIHSAQR